MQTNELFKKIEAQGIKVKKSDILEHINKYGYYRIVSCYGKLLKEASKECKKHPNTQELLALFEFDKNLANMIASYLFDFEQQLNTISMDEIFKINNLHDDYVLTITNNPAFTHLRKKGLSSFNEDIYENAKSCNLIPQNIDVRSLPLKILSLSWSFHTLISFIFLQDDNVLENICTRFNIPNGLTNDFISACHSIRKFRNILSHNGIFFSYTLSFYRREFNHLINICCQKQYHLDDDINIYKILILLEKILNKDILKTDLKKIFKETKLPKHIKKYVLTKMGFSN